MWILKGVGVRENVQPEGGMEDVVISVPLVKGCSFIFSKGEEMLRGELYRFVADIMLIYRSRRHYRVYLSSTTSNINR